MRKISEKLSYFSNTDKVIWTVSVALITLAFIESGGRDTLNYIASLIGVTSLIFCAKGNPAGPALMIAFAAFYGYISYRFAYYGELITYVGMTLPMSVWSLIEWLKKPYKGQRSQVSVNSKLSKKEWLLMAALTIAVTAAFYFILSALGTANIIPSTISVTTSFAAAYLTARRSPYYALFYAMNDIVLIVLWALAAAEDSGYISVVICFAVFLINDVYGFISWKRMEKNQTETADQSDRDETNKD